MLKNDLPLMHMYSPLVQVVLDQALYIHNGFPLSSHHSAFLNKHIHYILVNFNQNYPYSSKFYNIMGRHDSRKYPVQQWLMHPSLCSIHSQRDLSNCKIDNNSAHRSFIEERMDLNIRNRANQHQQNLVQLSLYQRRSSDRADYNKVDYYTITFNHGKVQLVQLEFVL